jgi:hypothetical protein
MSEEKKPTEKRKAAPWFVFAKSNQGKVETDPGFNKSMSSKWYLVGLPSFKSIIGSTRAWCGLACAVSLASIGLQYQKDGAAAINWDKFGNRIVWKSEGIPQGAIVRINHGLNCSSSKGNHVAMADGDCAPADLLKSGATINLYGGNQGNAWKVSTYSAREICSVTWPKDYAKPPTITKSVNCSGSKRSAESTR